MGEALRIANCSGFYGDRLAAAREMVEGGPIDVLTGDYLAELTLMILLKDRLRDPKLGYARTFLRQAAWKLDKQAPDATKFCAMAKQFTTDIAFKVANDALQLHGGYGYLAEYGIEKIVRDLRVHQILEGTNEIMRLIVSRHLLEEGRI